jgi:hypothetical protein
VTWLACCLPLQGLLDTATEAIECVERACAQVSGVPSLRHVDVCCIIISPTIGPEVQLS